MHNDLEIADSLSTTTLRDSSKLAHMPTFTGPGTYAYNLNVSAPKYGNASAWLYHRAMINVSDSSDWTLGTNNFTICAWYTARESNTALVFFEQGLGTNYNRLTTDGVTMTWIANRVSSETATGTAPLYANIPAQVCAVRNGTTTRVYVNGTSIGSTTTMIDKTDIAAPIMFGKNTSASSGINVDEVFFVNGAAIPAEDLMNPWPLYVNNSQYGYADDNYTVSLLHMDGSDGGTFFRDQVGNRTWTSYGPVVTATNASVFGTSGGFFGTGFNFLTTPYNDLFNLGTDDFTVEAWVTPRILRDNGCILSSRINGTAGYAFQMKGTGYTHVTQNGTVLAATPAGSLVAGSRQHVAYVRNGDTLSIFINGQRQATGAVGGTTFNTTGTAVFVGAWRSDVNTAYYEGTMDELRVSKGIARYTSNFTPQVDPFELIANQTWTATPDASATIPATIQFTDGTPSSAWTANTFLWDFGDGVSSTLRNPSHVYSTTGLFNVSSTVMNNNMTSTSYRIVRIGAPVVNFVCSPTTGTAALLVSCVDTTTNQTPITSYLIDWGDGTSDTTTPPWTHVYSTYSAFSINLTETNSVGTDYEYKRDYIVTSTSQEQQNTIYVPAQVRFKFIDFNTVPLDNLSIVATPLDFTGSINWTSSLIGIRNSVNITGTTVQGLTGTDGGIAFPMLQSQRYLMTISGISSAGRVVYSFNITMYPQQSDYTFAIPTNLKIGAVVTTMPQNAISYTIANASYNATAEWYNISYTDPTGGTNAITFFIANSSGYQIYTQTVTGAGANAATFSNLTANPTGDSVVYGFTANQTSLDNNITKYETNTFPGYISLTGSAPGDVELWVAIIVTIAVGLFASYMSKEIGVIIACILSVFFVYGIHWITPKYPLIYVLVISVFVIIAGVVYMRRREDIS